MDFAILRRRAFAKSRRLVEAAARLDESDTECHRIMCRLALLDGQFAKSEYHLERALARIRMIRASSRSAAST